MQGDLKSIFQFINFTNSFFIFASYYNRLQSNERESPFDRDPL
jgi:hypothetical protein